MNAQVTSMKEAQRLQQERSFREAAAQEEQEAEALATKVGGPEAAATTPGEGGKKKGMMGNVLDALGGTRKMFKVLLKRFALVAAGLGIAVGAAYMASDSKTAEGEQGPTDEGGAVGETVAPESPSSLITSTSTPPPQATPTAAPTPSAAPAQTPEQNENAFQLNKSLTGAASEMLGVKLPEPTRSAPAATPAAPPPSVAATAPTSDSDVSKVEEWFKRPENAADDAELTRLTEQRNVIQRGISSTKALLANAKTPEEKQQHQDILDKQLNPGLENVKKQRKALLDKAKTAMGVAPSTAAGTAPPAETGTAGGAMPSGGVAPSAPSTAGGVGASPVAPSTSTGAEIGSSSVAVAAGNEPKTPKSETVELNSSSTTGSAPPSMMPSPVADRGSLDVGTTFNTGG